MAGAAVSRRTVRYRRRNDRSFTERWPLFVRDFAFVIGVIAVYFLVRGIAPDRVEQAMAVTLELVRFEQALHLFIEPQIQEISIQSHAVQEVANFIYAYLHFPVLGAVAVWLWFRGRERFLFLRNVMIISMVIGILFYYFLPAAPPRLLAAHGYD
ncbi:MAG: phosphatase PAP2 family protein, partial [Dehalococcoidia bacterium]